MVEALENQRPSPCEQASLKLFHSFFTELEEGPRADLLTNLGNVASTKPTTFQIDTKDRLSWKDCRHKLHTIKLAAELQATQSNTTDAAVASICASLQTLEDEQDALAKSRSRQCKNINNHAG